MTSPRALLAITASVALGVGAFLVDHEDVTPSPLNAVHVEKTESSPRYDDRSRTAPLVPTPLTDDIRYEPPATQAETARVSPAAATHDDDEFLPFGGDRAAALTHSFAQLLAIDEELRLSVAQEADFHGCMVRLVVQHDLRAQMRESGSPSRTRAQDAEEIRVCASAFLRERQLELYDEWAQYLNPAALMSPIGCSFEIPGELDEESEASERPSSAARAALDDTMELYTERMDLTAYQATKLRMALLTSYDRQEAREDLANDGVATDILEGIAARDLADLDAVVIDLLSDEQHTAFMLFSGRLGFCDY